MEKKDLKQDFQEQCLIIESYADLIRVLEMDLSLIENPIIRDTVQTFQELTENINNLPELMHNILLYNMTMSFETNYLNIIFKEAQGNEQKHELEEILKKIPEFISLQKARVVDEMPWFKKLKKIIFKDNIKEIKSSEFIIELKNKLSEKSELLLKNQAKLKHFQELKEKISSEFINNFNIDLHKSLKFDIKGFDLSVQLESLNIKPGIKTDISLGILKTISQKEPQNQLNITEQTKDFFPSFMFDNVDNHESLRAKVDLINNQKYFEQIINPAINEINEYFVHRMDLSYLDNDINYEITPTLEKIYNTTFEKSMNCIKLNLDILQNNKEEILKGAAIFAGSYFVLKQSVDFHQYNPSLMNMLTTTVNVTATIQGILNFNAIKNLVGFASEMKPLKIASNAIQVVNDTLDGKKSLKVKKQAPESKTQTITKLDFERD